MREQQADVDRQYLEYLRMNRAKGERIQRYHNSLEELYMEKNGDKKTNKKNKNLPKTGDQNGQVPNYMQFSG